MSEEKGFTEEQARKLIDEKIKVDCEQCTNEVNAILAKWGCEMCIVETKVNGHLASIQNLVQKKKV